MITLAGKEWSGLFRCLQHGWEFIPVEDETTNQYIALRAAAIAEVWFSDDAADDYGPGHDDRAGWHYVTPIDLKGSDDWEIMRNLSAQCFDFDEKNADHQRVLEAFYWSEGARTTEEKAATWEALISGKCESDLLKAATHVTYQLSNGKRRQVYAPHDASDVYDFAWPVTMFPETDPERGMLFLRKHDDAQTAIIDPSALDYVIVPYDKYIEGCEAED